MVVHLFLLLKVLLLFFEILLGVLVQLLEFSVGLRFVSLLLPSVVLLLLNDVLQYCLLVVKPSVFGHDRVPVKVRDDVSYLCTIRLNHEFEFPITN